MIGLGVDVVDVERLRRALTRTPALADRLFTAAERAYAETAHDPAERYAARFAAKEAVMKSLGVGLGAIDWRDVEVVRSDGSGRPSLRVTGRAATLADDAGVSGWLVSLSHTASIAEAVVIAT